MTTDQNPPIVEEKVPVLFINRVPRRLFDQLTEESALVEMPRTAYIKGVLLGTTPEDRMAAFIRGKAIAGKVHPEI
jgi:hypothetical protein